MLSILPISGAIPSRISPNFYPLFLFYSHAVTIIKPGACRPAARAWFLRIASVRELLYACLCVCPPPRLSITSGVMWCDIDPIRLVE